MRGALRGRVLALRGRVGWVLAPWWRVGSVLLLARIGVVASRVLLVRLVVRLVSCNGWRVTRVRYTGVQVYNMYMYTCIHTLYMYTIYMSVEELLLVMRGECGSCYLIAAVHDRQKLNDIQV